MHRSLRHSLQWQSTVLHMLTTSLLEKAGARLYDGDPVLSEPELPASTTNHVIGMHYPNSISNITNCIELYCDILYSIALYSIAISECIIV